MVCTRHGEGVRGVDGNLRLILHPVDEDVALVGRGRQGDFVAIVIGASTRHNTAFFRHSIDLDFIVYLLEVGHVVGCAGHFNLQLVVLLYEGRITFEGPVEELIAIIRDGRQVSSGAVTIGSSTRHSTTRCGISLSSDFEGLQLEVSDKLDFAAPRIHGSKVVVAHREGVGSVCGDDHFLSLFLIGPSGPIDEVVALIRRSHDGDLIAIVDSEFIRTDQFSITAILRYDGEPRVILDLMEDCRVFNSIGDGERECISVVIFDFLTILHPVIEVVACVGRGRQGHFATVSVATSAFHNATLFWFGNHRDRIEVDREAGHIIGRFGDNKANSFISAEELTVLRPVDEGVAFGSRSNERAGFAVVVGTEAFHITTLFRIGDCSHHVVVLSEHSVVSTRSFLGHDEGVNGADGHLHLVVHHPVDEGITFSRRSGQDDSVAIGVCASAFHFTTIIRIGESLDLEGLQLEVGHIVGCTSHFNRHVAILCKVGRIAIERPVDKLVAFIRNGRQFDLCAVVVSASTRDNATLFRISRNGNCVALQCEVSHIFGLVTFRSGFIVDDEGVSRIGGNNDFFRFISTINRPRPVDEIVTFVSRGYQGAGVAIVVGAFAFQYTAIFRNRDSVDVVILKHKVGFHLGIAFDDERVLVFIPFADVLSADGPAFEVVSIVGRGHQGNGVTIDVGASAFNNTAVFRDNQNGNLNFSQFEEGHEGFGTRDGEAVSRFGADSFTIFVEPANEVVSITRYGGQSSSRSIVILASAFDSTSLVDVLHNRDLITLEGHLYRLGAAHGIALIVERAVSLAVIHHAEVILGFDGAKRVGEGGLGNETDHFAITEHHGTEDARRLNRIDFVGSQAIDTDTVRGNLQVAEERGVAIVLANEGTT